MGGKIFLSLLVLLVIGVAQVKAQDTNQTDGDPVEKSWCKKSKGNHCHLEGGICYTYTSKSQNCHTNKIFEVTGCPTCYCCIGDSGSGASGSGASGSGTTSCQTTDYCSIKGGYCSAHCPSNKYPVANLCGNGGCSCCVESGGSPGGSHGDVVSCEGKEKSSCKYAHGECKSKCHDYETEIKRGCKGKYGCKCCVPQTQTCKDNKKCTKKGGICCDEDSCGNSFYTPRFCGGAKDCGCCIKNPVCKMKSACKKNHGTCKGECGEYDIEVPKGCKGLGCKCCIDPDSCEASNKCTHHGGTCCSKAACVDGKFKKNLCGDGCGCCIHY